jgi:hypothetical protein
MIKSQRKLNCQLLSDGHNDIISLDDKVTTPASNNNCDHDTVTRSCIPCSLFLNGTCGRLKVCEKRVNQIECSCSAGWKNGDDKCEFQCDSGFYGTNCIKRCGHCYSDPCNHVDGTCNLCSYDYFGTKCDKKRSANPQNLTFPQNLPNDPELTRQHHAEIEETTQFLNKSLISNSTSKENDVVYNYTSDPTINHSKTKDQNSTSLHPYESFQETSFAKDIVIMILVLIVLLMMFKKSCIVKLKKICPLVSNESDQELLTPLDVIYTTPNNDSTKPDRPVYGAEGGLKINVNRNDKHPETYVVAEVPKHDEVEGFWQSLWNKNITNLVLVDIKQDKVLTNFWPRKNKIISYNNISIYCGVENIFKFYEYRTFTLTYNSETRLASPTNKSRNIFSTQIPSRSINFVLVLGPTDSNHLFLCLSFKKCQKCHNFLF